MEHIAIIGKNKDLLIFNLVGVQNVIILKNDVEISDIVEKLVTKNFTIIFIEENLISKIEDVIVKYENDKTLSIVGLPDIFNSKEIYNKKNIIYSKIKKLTGKNIY